MSDKNEEANRRAARIEFGRKLNAAFREKGYSSRSFAKALGVGVASVSRWTRGENYPKGEEMAGILRLLGKQLADLFTGLPEFVEGKTAEEKVLNLARLLEFPVAARILADAYLAKGGEDADSGAR